jgi:serine/threonine-protein kinase
MSDALERFKTALRRLRPGAQRTSTPIERLEVALADRYTIEGEIGSGGMATVFLAEDSKHRRRVAIKVLRPDLAAAVGATRFLNEITVTANLQHPHILPLHDSGEADSFLYYVMPYVEGESLRQRLNRERQLPVEDALRITSEIAAALESAHRQGVVHRDIKPENILLREGHAVVADFGIALAVSAAGGERLTGTGLPLGTPNYMSPEQVAGEREIDGRSDIYSLACVLYEMLAGDPPFTAANLQAVLLKHVSEPAPSVTAVRSDVPQPVASAVARALGKVPADRFASPNDFAEALFAEASEAEPEMKSIVVLPFENLSPDPDNAFFADGLTEELIAELSELRQLRVISRTSAMQFKDSKKGVPTIARELNVRYVLEGSVRRASESVRITAQLIDASTDSHLWAERYTGSVDDIFDLQEQLSRRIAEALRVALTPDEERRIASHRFADFRAYDALLRARQELMKPSKQGIERAIQLVHRAQEIAGENALIHATLARCYSHSFEFGISHDRETLHRADEHASKALELAPDLGLALFAKAHVRAQEGDFEEVVRLLTRAREIDRNADALSFLVGILATVGRLDEAREVAAEALLLDPLDTYTRAVQAWVDLLDGQFETATSRLQKTIEDLGLDNAHISWFLALAMAHSGRLGEAKEVFASVAATDAVPVADLSELYCRAADGDSDAVVAQMSEKHVMVEVARTDETFPIFIANCLAMVGDEDGALEWLGRAVDWGFCNYRYLQEHNPFLKPLHGNPRFTQLIDKARQKQKAFEV